MDSMADILKNCWILATCCLVGLRNGNATGKELNFEKAKLAAQGAEITSPENEHDWLENHHFLEGDIHLQMVGFQLGSFWVDESWTEKQWWKPWLFAVYRPGIILQVYIAIINNCFEDSYERISMIECDKGFEGVSDEPIHTTTMSGKITSRKRGERLTRCSLVFTGCTSSDLGHLHVEGRDHSQSIMQLKDAIISESTARRDEVWGWMGWGDFLSFFFGTSWEGSFCKHPHSHFQNASQLKNHLNSLPTNWDHGASWMWPWRVSSSWLTRFNKVMGGKLGSCCCEVLE